MKNKDFEEIGDRIQNIIEDAVRSCDYQKMNQTINDALNKAVNRAVETGNDALKNVLHNGKTIIPNTDFYKQKKEHSQVIEKPVLYGQTTGPQLSSILKLVSGGILLCGMGMGFLAAILVGALSHTGGLWTGVTGFMGIGTAAGAALTVNGFRGIAKLERFKKYKKLLGDHTYCDLKKLSENVKKPIALVKKDIQYMIDKKWFLEGHMDKQETCLITSNETFEQYMIAQREMERREREERPEVEIEKGISREVQEVLDKGNEYLQKIRQSNDAIPGVDISAKISKMEMIVKKIFERAKTHPEIIPDLKKLMNYYLPMTIKLLDAYEDMDKQPIQGENILSSKKEIEETLDTLNIAFEKLFDSVFQDTAMDVSSDISVLHTLLAQEGLTEDDISRRKKL